MEFRSDDPAVAAAASPRLIMSLHVLEKGSLTTPAMKVVSNGFFGSTYERQSTEIIKQQLRIPVVRTTKRSAEYTDSESNVPHREPGIQDGQRLVDLRQNIQPFDPVNDHDGAFMSTLGPTWYPIEPSNTFDMPTLLSQQDGSPADFLREGYPALPSAEMTWNWEDWSYLSNTM